MTSAWEAMF